MEGTLFDVVANRRSMVGFDPVLRDDRVEVVDPTSVWDGTRADHRVTGGVGPGVPWHCIYLVDGAVGVFASNLGSLHAGLERAGYEQVDVVTAGQSSVEVWQRTGAPPC